MMAQLEKFLIEESEDEKPGLFGRGLVLVVRDA
jgi:hypothetical protein